MFFQTELVDQLKVSVFAKGAKAQEAQEAGADFVGAEELVQKIQGENWFDYDVVVATPDMMGVVGRLGRVLLNRKGLMPNPKSGTVTFDVAKAIADIKAGKRLNIELIKLLSFTAQSERFHSELKSYKKTSTL